MAHLAENSKSDFCQKQKVLFNNKGFKKINDSEKFNREGGIKAKILSEEHMNKKLLLIDSNGEKLGFLSYNEILNISGEKGMDPLILKESDDLVVVKLVKLDKYLYEMKKKLKSMKMNAKNKLKEISYRLVTSDHDMERIKSKIIEWLNKKYKVKVNLQLKGREFNSLEKIRENFKLFVESLGEVSNISLTNNGFSAILEYKTKKNNDNKNR